MKENKNKLKSKQKYFLLIIFLLVCISFVSATSPLPTEFYGKVRAFNQQVSAGTIISVYDSSNNVCGTYTTRQLGYFGVLTCRGEDDLNDGPIENEIVSFKIGNQYATALVLTGYVGNDSTSSNSSNNVRHEIYGVTNVTWQSRIFKEVILVIPPLVCGDAFCDTYENCNSCTLDCGVCPVANGSTTGSNGSSSGGSSGSGGSTGSGGSSSGGAGGGGAQGGSAGSTGSGSQDSPTTPESCSESWECGDWEECLKANYQIRVCVDLNSCGTSNDIPDVTQDCIYIEDYSTNNRTGSNESISRPQKQVPGIISVCEARLNLLGIPSLLFILFIIVIFSVAQLDYKRKIKRIISDKSLDELKKLELKYLEKRKRFIFFIVVALLALVVYIYHYFFFLCIDKYLNYLWLLLIGAILVPIIVHMVLYLSNYSESRKNKEVLLLNDAHYKHVLVLISIVNEQLISSESNVVSKIYSLESKEGFNKLLAKDKIVEGIYKDMNKLFSLYKTLNNPMSIEKDLLLNIRKLDEDKKFIETAKMYPELAEIRSGLSMIYLAYEYKQGLYDELTNIEYEFGIETPVAR